MSNHKMQPPSPGFMAWWQPDGFNPSSGAQTGGHREALRKCVRPDTHEVRYYGINVDLAFNTRCYREEYLQWLKDGQPPREDDFDGTAATQDKVRACMANIRSILKDAPLLSGAEVAALKQLTPFQQVKTIMES